MTAGRRETGDLGEKLARGFLKKRGYRIIETNYRCPRGEIDIVARQRDCLVLLEVRTWRSLSFGTPEESVSHAKKARMRASAYHYLQSHDKLPAAWRIDFVAVELKEDGKPGRIEIIENAVWESE